ncbi:MAG: ImmA/IrrE family metallo-endopeptidase [Thermoguttaceae bacterium]
MARTGAASVEEAIVWAVRSLRQSARDLGFRNGTDTPPYDPWPLAVVLGADKLREKSLGFDGQVVKEGDGLAVEIDNAVASRQRRRFTLAHEVGHLALWKNDGKVIKTRAQRFQGRSEIETLCNRIASEVLAPRSEILQHLIKRTDEDRILALADGRCETRGTLQSVLNAVIYISSQFDVSLQFSAVRIKELGRFKGAITLTHTGQKKVVWRVGAVSDGEFLPVILESAQQDRQSGSGNFWSRRGSGGRDCRFVWCQMGRSLALAVLFG